MVVLEWAHKPNGDQYHDVTLRLDPALLTEAPGSRMKDDPAPLAKGGGLDALLRASDQTCSGLHIDRVVLKGDDLGTLAAVLVIRSGIAGRRQHKALVRLLRG
jgi:hypothetical protein